MKKEADVRSGPQHWLHQWSQMTLDTTHTKIRECVKFTSIWKVEKHMDKK